MDTPRTQSNVDFTPAGKRKRPRLIGSLALAVAAMMAFAGCASNQPKGVVEEIQYTRVVTANFRGETIAEYIAEGPVKRVEKGARFKAVERHIQKPRPRVIRYPLGRPVTVKAPNLLVEPTVKPVWLDRLDR